MGGGIGPQEELGIAAGGGFDQRLLVGVALKDRQAVVVGPDATRQHMVAVVKQVVCCDRGSDVGRGFADKSGRFAGSNVFQHHPQGGEVVDQLGQGEIGRAHV